MTFSKSHVLYNAVFWWLLSDEVERGWTKPVVSNGGNMPPYSGSDREKLQNLAVSVWGVSRPRFKPGPSRIERGLEGLYLSNMVGKIITVSSFMLRHWPSGYREGISWRRDSAWSGKKKQHYASVDITGIKRMSWKYMPWCRSLWYNHALYMCIRWKRQDEFEL